MGTVLITNFVHIDSVHVETFSFTMLKPICLQTSNVTEISLRTLKMESYKWLIIIFILF